MDEETMKNIQDIMLEELIRFESVTSQYQWLWETSRWHELVFCLLSRIDDSPIAIQIARETVEIFANLDLLGIDVLSALTPEKGEPNYQERHLALMLEIMERQGYDDEEAKRAVITIGQAARGLEKGFEGKVQKYLRKYGEQMLAEIPQNFSFSHLDEADAKYAFTHWLQNVLNLPIALSHPDVNAFCEKLGIDIEGLVEVADRNDVNIALVDDWATDYITREREMEASKPVK